jgi:phosphinothricin acetyltransferase
MRADDGPAVLRIYQASLDTDLASFETLAPTWAEFDRETPSEHRFVSVDDDEPVLGRTSTHRS